MKEYVNKVPIKPYSNKELAAIFCRSTRQWRREMAKIRYKIGLRPDNGHRYSLDQVIAIMEHFGRPYIIIEQVSAEEVQHLIESKIEAPQTTQNNPTPDLQKAA